TFELRSCGTREQTSDWSYKHLAPAEQGNILLVATAFWTSLQLPRVCRFAYRAAALMFLPLARLRPRRWTNLRLRRHLAQLQSANVSDDSPAIFYRNLRCIGRHCAPTV